MIKILVAFLLLSRDLLAQPMNFEEQAIKNIILNSNYSSTSCPASPTNIYVKLTMNKLVNVDENNQIVTTSSFLYVNWEDPRLVWNNTQYSYYLAISIQLKKIWFPDLYVINTAETNGYVSVSDSSLAVIDVNGLIITNLGLIGK